MYGAVSEFDSVSAVILGVGG